MPKYVQVRAERDKLEAWNHSFSCWEEKESSVSLDDIPLNLIHYCVVMLLSPHAGNWASCGALKYPDRGRDKQHSMIKYDWIEVNCCSYFPGLGLNCKLPVQCICEQIVKIQSTQNQAGSELKSARCSVQWVLGQLHQTLNNNHNNDDCTV